MKCLWARVRERKKAKKEEKNEYNDAALGNVCLFSLPSQFDDSQLQNALVYMIRCFFFLFVCCVLFTAIITVFFSLNDNIDIAPCIRILFQPRFKLVCSKLNLAFSVNNIAVTNCSREIKKMAIMKTQYSLEILFQNYFRR